MGEAMLFSLKEIEAYWADYNAAFRLRILKDGEWRLVPLNTRPEGATRAEKVRLREYVMFPDYLKEKTHG